MKQRPRLSPLTSLSHNPRKVAEIKNQGYQSSNLDDLTQDAASELASNANNEGMQAQVEFLLTCGWSNEDILGRLKINREENE